VDLSLGSPGQFDDLPWLPSSCIGVARGRGFRCRRAWFKLPWRRPSCFSQVTAILSTPSFGPLGGRTQPVRTIGSLQSSSRQLWYYHFHVGRRYGSRHKNFSTTDRKRRRATGHFRRPQFRAGNCACEAGATHAAGLPVDGAAGVAITTRAPALVAVFPIATGTMRRGPIPRTRALARRSPWVGNLPGALDSAAHKAIAWTAECDSRYYPARRAQLP